MTARSSRRTTPRAPPSAIVASVTRLVSFCREGGAQDRVLAHRLPLELRDDPPGAHHEDAMGKTQHLLVLGGDEENGDALGRQRVDQSVDRELRSYVDAARRLVRDEDAR